MGQSTHEPEVQLVNQPEPSESVTAASSSLEGVGELAAANEISTAPKAEVPKAEVPKLEVPKVQVPQGQVPKGSGSGAIAPPSRTARTGWSRRLLLGATFLTTACVSAAVGASLMLVSPLPAAQTDQEDANLSISKIWRMGFGYKITRPVNILVMGIDRVPDVAADSPDIFAGRSDTMLLVRIDPDSNTVNVLSIPRDTQVDIPGEGIHKINHANTVGGAELAAEVVRDNLDNVPIDRYVRVSTSSFRELVDLLGGVRVFVPYDMQYVDNTQKLNIDLKQGWQILDGDQAEQFARFRKDSIGDVGRVQRQQQLIRALRDRLTNPTVIAKLPEAIELLQRNLDTNLTLDEMLSLANFGLNLERDNFRMVMLPGRFSAPGEYVASYWIMDTEGRDQIMQEHFGATSIDVAQVSESSEYRIAIQNASGVPELGRRMARYLRRQGYSNVYVVNDWPDQLSETQIIAQRGDLRGASTLEQSLQAGVVVPASTGDLESDFTIRIGTDWAERLEEL